ncbi:hypothetical protein J6590_048354 [Homalodisca vitripennis]|nr:hypothetical protein J6590_048354 [Homalodisca vitripennis]
MKESKCRGALERQTRYQHSHMLFVTSSGGRGGEVIQTSARPDLHPLIVCVDKYVLHTPGFAGSLCGLLNSPRSTCGKYGWSTRTHTAPAALVGYLVSARNIHLAVSDTLRRYGTRRPQLKVYHRSVHHLFVYNSGRRQDSGAGRGERGGIQSRHVVLEVHSLSLSYCTEEWRLINLAVM